MFLSLRKRTRISAVSEGRTVTVEGTVRPTATTTLPGPGTPCVYYEMLTEVYKKGARGTGRPLWFPEKMERKLSGFLLDDGSGEIYIECPADQIQMNGGHLESGTLDKKGRRRFSARLIREGDTVRVRGIALPSPSGTVKNRILGPNQKGVLEMKVTRTGKQ